MTDYQHPLKALPEVLHQSLSGQVLPCVSHWYNLFLSYDFFFLLYLVFHMRQPLRPKASERFDKQIIVWYDTPPFSRPHVVTDSRKVADVFEKEHSKVMRSIKEIIGIAKNGDTPMFLSLMLPVRTSVTPSRVLAMAPKSVKFFYPLMVCHCSLWSPQVS